MRFDWLVLITLATGYSFAGSTVAGPTIPQEWLMCDKDTDCTSIEAGCYYWQPSNKSHVSDLTQNYGTIACLRSAPAGPRPSVSCINHVCTNGPYTVHYWKLLQADPIDASIQNQWIGRRLESCLQGMPALGTWDYLSWRDVYFRALVDQAIKENRFPDSTPLDVVISSVTSCEPLVSWQRGQTKWAAAQSSSNHRVRIETIPMSYSLDDVYPPLIEYAKVLHECGQSYIIPKYTFSGDMHAVFVINVDGTTHLDQKTTYPATAYMRPFLSCVNTAFEKIRFRPPKDRRPASVSALIQILPTDNKGTKEDTSRFKIEASLQNPTMKWSESMNVAVRILNTNTVPQTIGTETCGVHCVSGWMVDENSLLDVNQGGSCRENLVPPHPVILKPSEIYEQICTIWIKTSVRNLRPGSLTFRLGLQNEGHAPVWSNPVTVKILLE